MLVYLDMCCLKRPFDDQSQSRVRLETEALVGLLALEPELLKFVRSPAHLFENSLNPIPERAEKVASWLRSRRLWRPNDSNALIGKADELMALGLKEFDALHVATADLANSTHFVTCDDRLISAAKRNQKSIRPLVFGLIECGQEFVK